METYALICEGPCNPALQALDSLVLEQARGPVSGWSQDLLLAQRRLTYTPHHMVGRDHARCTECQYLRQYGDSDQ